MVRSQIPLSPVTNRMSVYPSTTKSTRSGLLVGRCCGSPATAHARPGVVCGDASLCMDAFHSRIEGGWCLACSGENIVQLGQVCVEVESRGHLAGAAA